MAKQDIAITSTQQVVKTSNSQGRSEKRFW